MSLGKVDDAHRALSSSALAMMASLYQHRLLSTSQLHTLHMRAAGAQSARNLLAWLYRRGLLDRVHGPGARSLWFLTALGADTVQSAGPQPEPRRRVLTPAQAAGPLRMHTLAVNQVGVEFVKAARERGDECTSDSWRNEVAHPVTSSVGRRAPELLVADALLSYLQISSEGSLVLHQRFVELDRASTSTVQLASKITRYLKLRHYTPSGARGELWRAHYRSFPHLLVVLADQAPERARARIQRALLLHHSDPARSGLAGIPVLFVSLGDLERRGPFAPVFVSAESLDQQVNCLGESTTER